MTLLEKFARASGATAGKPPRRRAIIDIGSNSVRLVIYDGPARAPFLLFNEKVSAGLGAALSETGLIEPKAMKRGLEAIGRFALLAREMDVAEVRCIATAAVREATNGGKFVAQARSRSGLTVEILSGEEEGRAAGYGVISAIAGADGIVADLGGGSLELARVKDGEVHEVVSLPLGVLRLSAIRARGKTALSAYIAQALKQAGWAGVERGLPLYLVGGSWRALAHLDMQHVQFPLPVIHQYEMAADRAATLARVTATIGKARVKKIPAISGSRIAALAPAAALLRLLVRQLGSGAMIVSAHGLREGLLYERLSAEERALDPLLVAAEAEGEAQGRFPGHGALIDRWIAPLFTEDAPDFSRIRQAACLLGDVGWRANPDFRAERGVEIALHGNWVGINGWGRAMLAQALYSNFGGGGGLAPGLEALASSEDLARACQWGLAIRLAQRLSGGVAGPLETVRLQRDDAGIALLLPRRHASLAGETVNRRLKQLGTAMGLEWQLKATGSA
ncbi:MAG: Ppx/GppA family phosphatase [Sphingobium sp.]|nr:Ppx/GppA family phosphatase [Sphingobium sp.]MBP8670216.1 Ppx/GppA family phosphatase [Sphingobium sp.]MBP9157250.1 Ppx/GppA family phosphatase [Sphingobium sp.]MCC6481910.1 Ppx/GppA family phosphatase [Sphingomonadaceae bacterium]